MLSRPLQRLGFMVFSILLARLKAPTSLLLGPLERRFPAWQQKFGQTVDGIVLLGGFRLDNNVGVEWSDISPAIPERVAATVRLSKLYPPARVLYSGGGSQ